MTAKTYSEMYATALRGTIEIQDKIIAEQAIQILDLQTTIDKLKMLNDVSKTERNTHLQGDEHGNR